MKNLKPYPHNSFDVHKNAVDRKNSSASKARLKSIESIIHSDYEKYDVHFEVNKIEHIPTNPFYASFKTDLDSLYNYQSNTINYLKGVLNNYQIRTIRYTCQNCTINGANTLDHILPQSKYPEYIVNPKNLFPCCSECNSFKSRYWENGGIKLFLNLYLDKLPEQQYLFVNIKLDNNDIDFEYFLDNKYNIANETFILIRSHYDKLHLLERMRFKANEDFSEFENSIISRQKNLSLDLIFEEIRESIIDDQKAYGYNHWKCVLKLAIISDVSYKSYIHGKYLATLNLNSQAIVR